MGQAAKSKAIESVVEQNQEISTALPLGQGSLDKFWRSYYQRNKKKTSHHAEITHVFPLSVNLSDEDPMFFSLDADGRLLLWSGAVGTTEAAPVAKLNKRPALFAIDPGRRFFAYVAQAKAGKGEAQLKVRSLLAADDEFTLDRLLTRVTSIDFQPGEDAILIGGADARLYRWFFREPRRGEITEYYSRDLERYVGHAASVSAVAFHPLGRVFFSGDWTGSLTAWLTYESDQFQGEYDKDLFFRDFFTHQRTQKRARRSGISAIDHIVIPANGQRVYAAFDSGHIELWDVRGWHMLTEAKLHTGLMYSIASSSDGQKIVSCGRDGFLRVWQLFESRENSEGELRYLLVLAYETEFAGGRVVNYINDNTVVVGSENGELIKLDLRNIEAPTPDASAFSRKPIPHPEGMPGEDEEEVGAANVSSQESPAISLP